MKFFVLMVLGSSTSLHFNSYLHSLAMMLVVFVRPVFFTVISGLLGSYLFPVSLVYGQESGDNQQEVDDSLAALSGQTIVTSASIS